VLDGWTHKPPIMQGGPSVGDEFSAQREQSIPTKLIGIHNRSVIVRANNNVPLVTLRNREEC
jgi:hypothetical protein